MDQVHRFTTHWERDASLRLRRGDPMVAHVYDMEDRFHGGTSARMEREALDAWWTARHRGETVVLAAPTNETVARLNHAAQQRRIDTGDLNPRGRHVDATGYRFHVGDEIATRQNERELHTDHGLMIRTRDQWTIDTIHRNGDLTVTGRTGTARLPAHYVQQHVALAYAQTSHATQGRTVDRSILVLDGPTDVRGIYVPMTRGRHHNDAYIVTAGEQTALDVFADSIGRSWIDQPAHARQAELIGHNPHRPGTLGPETLRTLFGEQARLTATLQAIERDLEKLPAEYERTRIDHLTATAELDESRKELQHAFDTIDQYDKPFRRRSNEARIASAQRTVATLPDHMRDQAARVETLRGRLDKLDRQWRRAEQLDATRPALESHLDAVTDRLDDDRRVRSRQLRRQPSDRVVGVLGRRPGGGELARRWDRSAATVDQHQSAFGLSSGLDARAGGRDQGRAFPHSRAEALREQRAMQQALRSHHEHEHRVARPVLRIGR